MPRRVDLPGAAELFRPTSEKTGRREPTPAPPAKTTPAVEPDAAPSSSGRVRHEEKITVYVSSEELLALEQLRLTLRAQHGVGVDRGRIVRAAIAEAVADVQANGAASRLVQRLSQA